MNILACDGPLNGNYVELEEDPQEGDVFSFGELGDYEATRWPKAGEAEQGELVLVSVWSLFLTDPDAELDIED